MKRQLEAIEVVELKPEESEVLLKRVKASVSEEDFCTIELVFKAYFLLMGLIEQGRMTIKRLQKIIFGAKSEKSSEVLKKDSKTESCNKVSDAGKQKRKGHGRNGKDAYTGAKKVKVSIESLNSGDDCPKCDKGKVYRQACGVIVRFIGQAPVDATIYELEKLRCNLCGKIFTARAPEEAKKAKYEETVPSIIALEKYGAGLPFNRNAKLQTNFGIPLPSSTQWDLICGAYKLIVPAFDELIRQAANGKVLHNDDTGMVILGLCGKRLKRDIAEGKHTGERTGIFTSGIISHSCNQKIALFFTGNRHAGENLARVLRERKPELPPPIQMCDALSRNVPKDFKTILAHCNCHGRRKFVDVLNSFPEECEYVLDVFREIYINDAVAKKRNMTPKQRLAFHKANSGPLMDKFHDWMEEQFEQKKIEPNSGLGEAITYMLNHWGKLTLFLSKAGVPLDNNICERALKKAIMHRKNSLFYKTTNGAKIGDAFMSLICSAEFAGAKPFDYLNQLQRHATEVASSPSLWMPWNYRQTIAALSAQKAA